MSLPKFHAPRDTVQIEDELIEIRGLTRAEAARCQRLAEETKNWAELEIAVIAAGTDSTVDETRDWYGTVPSHVAEDLFNAIRVLSRIEEGASKSGGESDSAGG